jgi:hypothetical protein
MAFKQPCFIRKNTPELRKKLEELGYTNGAWESPHFEYPYLMCFPNRKFGLFKGEGFYMTEDDYRCDGKRWTYNPPKEYIDCGDNEDLFLALAALRDDSDINQYFFCDKVSFTIGKTYYPDDYLYYQYDEFFDKQNWHKATVEEIIEHFKKE